MSTSTTSELPGDGQVEVSLTSADPDATDIVWKKAMAALGHHGTPRRSPTGDGNGVRLYGIIHAPDRPLPGQQNTDDSSTGHLMAGPRITVDELAVHCSAAAVWLDQLARAAETPDTPVELADEIDTMRREATTLRGRADRLHQLARIIAGDVPLSTGFRGGDRWGAAAVNTDRADYGGPAIIPTGNQLIHLADTAQYADSTITYPEGMDGVPRSLLKSWESKTAQQRRAQERDAAIALEVRQIECESCGAGSGEPCRTKNGRAAEQSHTPRRREAEANVDARIGWLGDNPVAVNET